jgi:hypothetical protein
MGTKFLRNPLLMALVGALAGCLGGVALGAVILLLLNTEPAKMPETSTAAASTVDIEVVAEEYYINRIMVESANDMAGPVSLTAGTMDLRPGAVADFVVALKIGPVKPVIEGTVGFRATDDGSSIEVLLLDARFGRVCLNRLVPASALDDINAEIQRMLVDRVGSQGLSVLEVRSDDSTLRLHLGGKAP